MMVQMNCKFCGKEIKNLRHEGLCGKNPQRRGIKKGGKHKNHNDKTKAAGLTIPATSQGQPSKIPQIVAPVALESSHSKILTEINLKGEFDKMTEILNPKKKDIKEKKYKCGACGATFDNLQDSKCPDCQEQLQ